MLINYPLFYLHGWRPHPLLAIRSWLSRHINKIKSITISFGVLIVIFIVVNGLLMVLESGKMPLFTRVNGQNVGLKTVSELRDRLQLSFDNQLITLSLPNGSHVINAKNSGIALDIDKTLQLASSKTGWRRLPLINLFSNLNSSITPIYSVNNQKLSTELASVIELEKKNPVDAKLVVPLESADAISIIPAQNGFALNPNIAAEQISNSVSLNSDFVVQIAREVIYPKIKTTDLQQILDNAKSLARAKITLKSTNSNLQINDEAIRGLMTVRADNEKPIISLDKTNLINHLNNISGNFYIAPIATSITLLDGEINSTITGTTGQALDSEKTASSIISAFEAEAFDVNAILRDVPSPKIYKRTYSNSNQGLYKLIEDFANSHKGSYKVAVVELKDGVGSTRSAFYGADEPIITASTFKVFVAYATLLKIEQGVYNFQTQTSHGTIDHCIHQMLIPSDDVCALALQHLIGWSEIDKILAAAGFSATDLNNSMGGDKTSTARDEMSLLTKLYNGELLSKGSVDYLFDIMDEQVYRSGIIAGSRGARAPSKVGILYGLRHDIGVVYSPKATYAVVILTNNAGGNFANIKQLSEQIYDFYNK